MSLESAEKLVERILRQLGVPYQVETTADGAAPRLVMDAEALANLPPELHPYVDPRPEPAAEASPGENEETPPRS